MDPASGFCRGCYRSIREIAGWLDFSPDEKRRVVADAIARKAAAEEARQRRKLPQIELGNRPVVGQVES
jgi:hypothetical protein